MSYAMLNARYWGKAECSICGEVGSTDSNGIVASWYGQTMVHVNPAVCRDVLARKVKKIKEALDAAIA